MTPIERMREICSGLPDVAETSHYGDTMFKSRGRAFASFGEKDGVARVVVQLESTHVEAVLAEDPLASRYPRAKDCVALQVTDATDWDEVGRLVLESHRLNAKKKSTTKTAATRKKLSRARKPPKK